MKDGPSAADTLGEDFYKVILENEPFKSTKVCLQLLFCFSRLTKVVECVYTYPLLWWLVVVVYYLWFYF